MLLLIEVIRVFKYEAAIEAVTGGKEISNTQRFSFRIQIVR